MRHGPELPRPREELVQHQPQTTGQPKTAEHDVNGRPLPARHPAPRRHSAAMRCAAVVGRDMTLIAHGLTWIAHRHVTPPHWTVAMPLATARPASARLGSRAPTRAWPPKYS